MLTIAPPPAERMCLRGSLENVENADDVDINHSLKVGFGVLIGSGKRSLVARVVENVIDVPELLDGAGKGIDDVVLHRDITTEGRNGNLVCFQFARNLFHFRFVHIQDHDSSAVRCQATCGCPADVSGAARDQDCLTREAVSCMNCHVFTSVAHAGPLLPNVAITPDVGTISEHGNVVHKIEVPGAQPAVASVFPGNRDELRMARSLRCANECQAIWHFSDIAVQE